MLIHLDLVLFMRKSWKKGMGKNKASLMLLLVGFYTGTFQTHIKQEKTVLLENLKMNISISI